MKSAFLAFVSISLFIIPACTPSLQVFSDRDKDVDLKKYKSYAWLAPGDSVLNAPRPDKIYGDAIMHYANVELKKKGMVIDTRNPDALIVFETRIENVVQYTQSPSVNVGVGFGGPGYYMGGYAPVSGGQLRSSMVEQGMLVFHLHDTRSGKEIWYGGARKTLTKTLNMDATIKSAVQWIFTKLQVKHKKK